MSSRPPVDVLPHYSHLTKTTSYLVVDRDEHYGVFVDPVRLDHEVFRLILDQSIDLRAVLITYPTPLFDRGISTVEKIFDVTVYSGTDETPARNLVRVEGEHAIRVGRLEFRCIPALSHSRASLMYYLPGMVFTGPIVHAGTLGDTPNPFAESLLVATVQDYVFTLPESTILLPAVGPPSSVMAEKRLSPFYGLEA